MRATVLALTHPKSEHTAINNEDAFAYDAASGLFAVADGVGSASFSGEWARILVQHFLAEPLLGDDPFEVEWWLRRAQRLYEERTPAPESLPPFAQEKARRGGAATLVTLRLTAVSEEVAKGEVLACGDSCAIVRRADNAGLESFPLHTATAFAATTLALPARVRHFDRTWQRCARWEVSLSPGDAMLLATDAVAKAVLAGGTDAFAAVMAAVQVQGAPVQAEEPPVQARGGTCSGAPSESIADSETCGLRACARATQGSEWSAVISRWRRCGIIADDDSTALCIGIGQGDEELGCTVAPAAPLVAVRQAELATALSEGRLEAVALAYGDGLYHGAAQLAPVRVEQARLVADAIQDVRSAIIRHLASGREQSSLAAVWDRWSPLLDSEPSAQVLRRSLVQLGLPLQPPAWGHLEAFRAAVDQADAAALVSLAPPPDLHYLLTKGERELVRQAQRRLRRRRAAAAGSAHRREGR